MRGSGSHSIRFENVRVPARFAIENMWMIDVDVANGTLGSRLHGNPMHAIPAVGFFQTDVSAIVVGAAKGAIAEYERIIRRRTTQRPPIVRRYDDDLRVALIAREAMAIAWDAMTSHIFRSAARRGTASEWSESFAIWR